MALRALKNLLFVAWVPIGLFIFMGWQQFNYYAAYPNVIPSWKGSGAITIICYAIGQLLACWIGFILLEFAYIKNKSSKTISVLAAVIVMLLLSILAFYLTEVILPPGYVGDYDAVFVIGIDLLMLIVFSVRSFFAVGKMVR